MVIFTLNFSIASEHLKDGSLLQMFGSALISQGFQGPSNSAGSNEIIILMSCSKYINNNKYKKYIIIHIILMHDFS